MRIAIRIDSRKQTHHTTSYHFATNKKGLTSRCAHKPLCLLVGTDRFELSTSTVSG